MTDLWTPEGFSDTFMFELEEVTVYEIYDPGRARIVATFTDKAEAEAYLEARRAFSIALAD